MGLGLSFFYATPNPAEYICVRPVTLMLRYQSVGNGYQRSRGRGCLAFTSEEHVGERKKFSRILTLAKEGTLGFFFFFFWMESARKGY